ncbi:MAG: hypothetical protein Q9225_006662 [Loekoesia sp. 1 TL-2023]
MSQDSDFGSRCNDLFLSLLATLPEPGSTAANPIKISSTPPRLFQKFGSVAKMGGGSGSMTWDDTADKNLLLQIIAGQDVRVDYALVAPYFGCSVSAIKQRVLKLKNQAKEQGFALKPNEASPGNDTDSPLKGKTAKGKAAATKNGTKGKAKETASNEDGAAAAGEGDNSATPTKKRGRKPKADGETKTSPAKKQKKEDNNDMINVAPTKAKGKKTANANTSSSATAANEGSASRSSSEATTIKMEGVEDNDNGINHHYTTTDGSGALNEGGDDNAGNVEAGEGLGLEDAADATAGGM